MNDDVKNLSENRPQRGGQSPFVPDHLAMVPAPQKGTVPGGSRIDVKRLLASYPRERPPLPPKLQAIYHDTYVSSREGRTVLYRITQSLEAWMHRRVAADSAAGQTVLEIGAGTLNHLRFEAKNGTYDVVEPYTALYDGRPETARVRAFYADIADVPSGNRYDRIKSIATLEHVLDLPRLVAQAAMLLAPNGSFAAGIPSEGGFLWGLAWRSSVGLSFRLRTGLNYGDLMRHEHVNRAAEIEIILRHFFERVRIRRFPTPSRQLSLYTFLHCRQPRLDRCRELAG
jgi:SAM-dependent methyltransferase